MKTRILLSLVITLFTCGSVATQTDGELREVTLFWYHPSASSAADRSRSSVNFETGDRGMDRVGSYDLRYGGMILGTPTKPGEVSKLLYDWLGVLDCRSMVVDLGAKKWQDFKATPPFPKPKTVEPPRPLGKPICAVDTSAGRTEFSPYRQFVEPTTGHMYLVRLLRGNKVSYVMFRVESLVSRDNCVLSWKLVKPPNVSDNETF